MQRRAHCKESSLTRQADATIAVDPSPHCHILSEPNLTLTRRHNALQLFQQFAEARMRAGEPPKGLEQAFAQALQVSPSMWSQIKSSRPIGDKLARQIEVACSQANGWLDAEHDAPGLSPAEEQFLDLALKAWRGSNAAGRKQLKLLLKQTLA